MSRLRRETLYEDERPKHKAKSPADVETTVPPTDKNGEIVNALLVKARKKADKESEVVEFLRKGTKVKILGQEKGFYKISISETEGYIMSEYIKEE